MVNVVADLLLHGEYEISLLARSFRLSFGSRFCFFLHMCLCFDCDRSKDTLCNPN
jgi:hypothetical protein